MHHPYYLPHILANRDPAYYYGQTEGSFNRLYIREFDTDEMTDGQYLEYLKDLYSFSKSNKDGFGRLSVISDGEYRHLAKPVTYPIITRAYTSDRQYIAELKIPLRIDGPQISCMEVEIQPIAEDYIEDYFKKAKDVLDEGLSYSEEGTICLLSLLSKTYVTANFRISDSSNYNTLTPSKTKPVYWDDRLVDRQRWLTILDRVKFEPPKHTEDNFILLHDFEPIYIPTHFEQALRHRLKYVLELRYGKINGLTCSGELGEEEREKIKIVFDKLVEDYIKKEGQL